MINQKSAKVHYMPIHILWLFRTKSITSFLVIICICCAAAHAKANDVNHYIEQLRKENTWEIRDHAAKSLEKMGDIAIDPLIVALRHPDSGVRDLAAEVLGRLHAKKAVIPLIDAIMDPESGVRASVLESLEPIGDNRVVKPVLSLILCQPIPNEKGIKYGCSDNEVAAASRLLRRYDTKRESVGPLINALQKENIRDDAIYILGELRDSRAIPPLTLLLREDKAGGETLQLVSNALVEIGGSAIQTLVYILKNEGESKLTKPYIIKALSRCNDRKAIMALIETFNHEDEYIRKEAIFAFEDVNDSYRPLLVEALDSKDAKIRRGAIAAIPFMGYSTYDPNDFRFFLKALGDKDPYVRIEAARVVTPDSVYEWDNHPHNPELLKIVNEKVKNGDTAVAIGAHVFLILQGDKETENILIKALETYGNGASANVFFSMWKSKTARSC